MDQPDHSSLAEPHQDEPVRPDPGGLRPDLPPEPWLAVVPRSASRYGTKPPSWTDLFDPRQPEAFLAFCSAWCVLQMCIWPNEFASANALVTTEVGLRGHERIWAIFGGVAALLKMAGLASRMSPRWASFSVGLRASGLFMSIIFWMIVGVSRVLDFPHLVTPVALVGLGMAAAFELAERRDPRETWR